MEGLEPSRLTALDPKSSADTNFATSRKKHSNDFRSHICQNHDRFVALPARTKVLYLYSHTFVSLHFMKLFYSVPPTWNALLNLLIDSIFRLSVPTTVYGGIHFSQHQVYDSDFTEQAVCNSPDAISATCRSRGTRTHRNQILNLARMPIPPRSHFRKDG